MLFYAGNEENPIDCFLAIPAGTVAFVYVQSGSSLLVFGEHSRVLGPGHSVTLTEENEARLRVGRNLQQILLFFIPRAYLAGLMEYASRECEFSPSVPFVRQLGACPVGRLCYPHPERDLAELYVWASMQFSHHDADTSLLIHPGIGQDSPFEELLEEVRKSPNESWSLKRAADMVGYSTFHFSRTFRAVTKLGVPDYVDRARTDFAVDRILNSEDSYDAVAQQSGFGTTSSLRSALKEHLGLLPSELRR
jgi:AraC-like DNA-binding protein